MGCLHDPANVQQTSSKCIKNTRANAGRLLKVCWTFAGSCKHPIRPTFCFVAKIVRFSSLASHWRKAGLELALLSSIQWKKYKKEMDKKKN